MLCLKCGHNNAQGANYCTRCNAALPKMTQTDTAPPTKVNERYMQLKEAGEKAKSGEWTIEQYGKFLQDIQAILAQKEQEIREIEIPEEAIEEFAEELEVGFNGIELYNQGIANMLLFLEDKNADHIDYGLELVHEGNEKINEAMRINRENRRKLEEMYIDNSTLM
ncbi:MAG: zinc ribbon domain-containing protein [Candidatus Eremiobacteraeota bacterium]|nr:zinc ribbon domain-containing protein [Candidatus Eremiobacteraeota bacterium]